MSAAFTMARSGICRRSLHRPPALPSSTPRVSRSPTARAFWFRRSSPIRTLTDLKGKRIGFTKGSSAHNVVLLALNKAGLNYSDITPVYLTPPDAGPAFAQGSIDAWADLGSVFRDRRVEAERPGLGQCLGGRPHQLVLHRQSRIRAAQSRIAAADQRRDCRHREMGGDHRDEVAQSLSAVTDIPLDIQTVAANRASFAIGPITDDIVATQQAVADRFYQARV